MDGPAERPPRDNKPNAEGPRLVPRVRNEHGTRVAKQITCSRCGTEDTVHFIPRKGEQQLCRRCAAELLGVGDEEGRIFPPRPPAERVMPRKEKLQRAEPVRPKDKRRKPSGKVLRVKRQPPNPDEA